MSKEPLVEKHLFTNWVSILYVYKLIYKLNIRLSKLIDHGLSFAYDIEVQIERSKNQYEIVMK